MQIGKTIVTLHQVCQMRCIPPESFILRFFQEPRVFDLGHWAFTFATSRAPWRWQSMSDSSKFAAVWQVTMTLAGVNSL